MAKAMKNNAVKKISSAPSKKGRGKQKKDNSIVDVAMKKAKKEIRSLKAMPKVKAAARAIKSMLPKEAQHKPMGEAISQVASDFFTKQVKKFDEMFNNLRHEMHQLFTDHVAKSASGKTSKKPKKKVSVKAKATKKRKSDASMVSHKSEEKK